MYGAAGVVSGAWGSHGLSAYLGHSNTGAWDTAVQYQLIHALALLLVGIMMRLQAPAEHPHDSPSGARLLAIAGWLMIVGVLLFSGSIYLLVLGGPSWLGPLTPAGGTAFIVAWVCLLIAALRWP